MRSSVLAFSPGWLTAAPPSVTGRPSAGRPSSSMRSQGRETRVKSRGFANVQFCWNSTFLLLSNDRYSLGFLNGSFLNTATGNFFGGHFRSVPTGTRNRSSALLGVVTWELRKKYSLTCEGTVLAFDAVPNSIINLPHVDTYNRSARAQSDNLRVSKEIQCWS